MLKSELFEILEANIIDKENEEEVRFLLTLSKEETRVLLLNLEYGKGLLNFFKENRNGSKYEEFLSNISYFNDIDVLQELYSIYNNEILLSSKYHAKVFEIAKEINISFLLEKFYDLATNENLLKSEHYEYVIENAKDIGSFDIFDLYISIVTDKDLMESEEYLFAIDEALKIKNPEILEEISRILTDRFLLKKSVYYHDVIQKAESIKNVKLLRWFCALAFNEELFNHKDYLEVLDMALNIKKEKRLELFYDFATDSNLINNERYFEFLKVGSSIKELNRFVVYQKVVREMYNSKNLDLAIKAILSIDNPKILSNLPASLTNKKIIESNSYEKILTIIMNQNSIDEYMFFTSAVSNDEFLDIISKESFDYAIDLIYKKTEKVKGFNKGLNFEYIKDEKQKEIDILDLFISLVTNTSLAYATNYKDIIDYADSIKDYDCLLVYKELVCDANCIDDLDFYNVFARIKEKPNVSLIKLYHEFLNAKIPIDYASKKSFIHKLVSIDVSDRVYEEIIAIFDAIKTFDRKLKDSKVSIYKTVSNALYIQKEEDILFILNEINNEIIMQIKKTKEEKNSDKFNETLDNIIEDGKVVNIIRKQSLEEIKESLKSIKDDEDINTDSFVKLIKKD